MTKSSIVLPSARYREYENEIAKKNVILSNIEQKLAGTEEELHAAQEEIAKLKKLLAEASKN